jgi:hypothetical protein
MNSANLNHLGGKNPNNSQIGSGRDFPKEPLNLINNLCSNIKLGGDSQQNTPVGLNSGTLSPESSQNFSRLISKRDSELNLDSNVMRKSLGFEVFYKGGFGGADLDGGQDPKIVLSQNSQKKKDFSHETLLKLKQNLKEGSEKTDSGKLLSKKDKISVCPMEPNGPELKPDQKVMKILTEFVESEKSLSKVFFHDKWNLTELRIINTQVDAERRKLAKLVSIMNNFLNSSRTFLRNFVLTKTQIRVDNVGHRPETPEAQQEAEIILKKQSILSPRHH